MVNCLKCCGILAEEETLFFCYVTCISYKVWLYCLEFGDYLAEEVTVYVFVVVTGISYKVWLYCLKFGGLFAEEETLYASLLT